MNYLIISHDPYLKEKTFSKIRNNLFGRTGSELNIGVFYGDTHSAEDILSFVSTMPFGAKYRLALVKNADKMSAKTVTSVNAYMKNEPGYSVIVFDVNDEPAKNKGWEELIRRLKVINLSSPKGVKYDNMIKDELAGSGKDIDHEAIRLIKELVGEEDTALLKNEIDKIICFTGAAKSVTKKDVEQVVGKSSKEDIFGLVKHIEDRDRKRALDVLSGLFLRKVSPQEIIGLLAWHFRRIGLGARKSSLNKRQLKENIDLLLGTDIAVKSTGIDPETLLEITVMKLCGK